MENVQGRYTATSAVVSSTGLSAVAWGAVIAGAVVAAALSMALIVGGAGLGFVSMSPWETEGASAASIGVGAIIWLFVTQIIAYGVAGYLTGRLRKGWAVGYSDETYFRDSAHGLLVWAVSAVFSAFLVGSAVISATSSVARVAGQTVAGVGQAATDMASSAVGAGIDDESGTSGYFIDSLFRSTNAAPSDNPGDERQEAARIVAMSVVNGEVSAEDRQYLSNMIAARTGMTEQEANQRIDDVMGRMQQTAEEAETTAREAADAARKAAAGFALWAFASLLVGAFVATYMAIVGGRHAREP